MKKTLLLFTALLFQITLIFGQSQTYAWGAWVQNPCFKGIQSRSKVHDYNQPAKQYTWDVEIKNNYAIKVSLNFDIKNSSIDGRVTINPGTVNKSQTLNPSNSIIYLEVSKVCFHHPNGFDQCSDYDQKGYASFAECDNGVPKYRVYAGTSNNTNASKVSPANNRQQSTPTTYTPSQQTTSPQNTTATNSGIGAINNNQTQAVNNNIAAVSSVATQLAGTIDAAIAAGKERKKAEAAKRASVNDIENAQLWKAFTNDLIMQFEKNGYSFKEMSQSMEQTSAKRMQEKTAQNGTPDFRMRDITIGDLQVIFSWHYDAISGNDKHIIITNIPNQEAVNDIKAKILNKYIKPKKITSSKDESGKFSINATGLQFANSDITNENLNYAGGPVTDAELYEQGRDLYNQKNITDALPLLKKAADMNNAPAMFFLGAIYDPYTSSPDHARMDENQARLWYEKASNLGNLSAMEKLGEYYKDGHGGLTKDYEKAAKWMVLATEKGGGEFDDVLPGMFKEGGFNLKPDYVKALKYYARIQSLPLPWQTNVKFNMGKIYLTGGYGVDKDLVKAKTLFQEACSISDGKKYLLDLHKSACDAYNSL